MSKRTTSFFIIVDAVMSILLVFVAGSLTGYFAWKGEWLGVVAVFIAHSVGYWTRAIK